MVTLMREKPIEIGLASKELKTPASCIHARRAKNPLTRDGKAREIKGLRAFGTGICPILRSGGRGVPARVRFRQIATSPTALLSGANFENAR